MLKTFGQRAYLRLPGFVQRLIVFTAATQASGIGRNFAVAEQGEGMRLCHGVCWLAFYAKGNYVTDITAGVLRRVPAQLRFALIQGFCMREWLGGICGRRWRNLSAALLLALFFALAMAALLNFYKFRNTLSALARDNVAVAAQDIEESVRLSQSLGLPLAEMHSLPALLTRQAAIDPSIQLIRISEMTGHGVYSSRTAAAETMPEAWLKAARRAKNGDWQVQTPGRAVYGRVLKNDFNLPLGLLAIEYSTVDIETGTASLQPLLLQEALLCLLLGILAGGLLLAILLRLPGGERSWPATALIVLLTAAALAGFSWRAVPYFEQHLLPELEQKARLIAQVEAALIGKALSHGLAVDELYGVEAALTQDLQQNRGLAAIMVRVASGRLLYQAQGTAPMDAGVMLEVPIMGPAADRVGSVQVRLDPAFAQVLVRELALDMVVVLVVALFLTLELLAYLPMAQAEARADPLRACRDIRTPAFIFFLSEELTRPFLPGFVADIAPDSALFSQALLIGLPISLFMLIVALSQPWLGALCQRLGQRRLLLGGAVVAAAGFVACACVTSLLAFLASRAACAFGYAAVFVAAQNHVLERTDLARRSAGFALFVGAIMVATVCGPSIGGMLADNIGARATFVVAAVLSLLALPFIWRLPVANGAKSEGGQLRLLDFRRLLRNRRFLGLTLGAAVPAKILLTAGCFYLLPLYVISLGSSQTMAGRLLMVYAVCMVVLMPLAARLADQYRLRGRFVLVGLCLSALGGLVAFAGLDLTVALALVLGLGLGQSLSIAAQSTLVGLVCPAESAEMGSGVVYGVYRLLERLGNAAGPLLAAALLAGFGFQAAFIALSVLALLAALFFYFAVARQLDETTEASA